METTGSPSPQQRSVVIVGAGPVGLLLACELRLAGLDCVVLDKRTEPSALPRANGIGGQIYHLLDQRGLLERFREGSPYSGAVPRFPFGPIPLELGRLTDDKLHMVLIQQPRMEVILAERASELGAEIHRGHEVVGLEQNDDEVALRITSSAREGNKASEGSYEIKSKVVVGCDGAHSFVRQQAGIDFPGTTDDEMLRLGHFKAPDGMGIFDTEVELPGLGRISTDWTRNERGAAMVTSLQAGVVIVATRELLTTEPTRQSDEPTLEELCASFHHITGQELPLSEPIWISRTVGQARLASAYRAGRVFLAGDAAHQFPAGGASLNIGMTDAINLGWRLGLALNGYTSLDSLDSYHVERHRAGERALMQTRVQAMLARDTSPDGLAMREFLTGLFSYDETLAHVARIMNGVDVLSGAFISDLELQDSPRLAELLRDAWPILLLFSDLPSHVTVADGWSDRIRIVNARCDSVSSEALLIRPDGHLAWDGGTPESLREALTHHFGLPSS